MIYKIEKEHFIEYCYAQIESIKTAIQKKANGSTVENGYFQEHYDKLGKFFLEHEIIEEKNERQG